MTYAFDATSSANWSYPTNIRFGAGRIAELPDACRAAGIQRPLIVTDHGTAALEICTRAQEALARGGMKAELFAQVDPNPTERNLARGLPVYRAGGHDGVVAFGGGSGLDLGKMIAFMAGQTRPVWDFEDIGEWWTRADRDGIAPIVAVPTTAGTGSEVGRASVLTNSETQQKKIIFHPEILPRQVILDPELTLELPPALTAGTGLDTLAHCLEALCAPRFHPFSHGLAVEGLRIVAEYLPRAWQDGSDIEARGQLMAAAAMGATAFQKGLGAIHALSHPIGARFHTHHGTTNAVILPQALRMNREACEAKVCAAARYLGIEGGFDGFLAFAEDLNVRLQVPSGLRAMGVDPEAADWIVGEALRDPSAGSNPVEMTHENTRALLQACL